MTSRARRLKQSSGSFRKVTDPVVLFASGRGGDPVRHQPFLDRIRAAGLNVIAPIFPMLPLGRAKLADLEIRMAVLERALEAIDRDRRVIGVGHSIGATLLLAKAGANLWVEPDARVLTQQDQRLARLILMAPPVGFFAVPHALDSLRAPLTLRVGSLDEVTPVSSYAGFAAALPQPKLLDFAVVDGADHFSFMDTRPPGQDEPFAGAQKLREDLADRIISIAHG